MALQHLDNLARELRCSICLCVMAPPVARLPCCHYFCMPCIQQSVRHRAQCPVCKAKVGRRDIDGDETMDRVVQAFAQLEANKDELGGGSSSSDDEGAELAPAGAAAAAAVGKRPGCPEEGQKEGMRQQRQGCVATYSLYETAPESLEGPLASGTDHQQQQQEQQQQQSPDTVTRPPAAGGICWLPGVDNEDYRSPSLSCAGSGHQPRQQQRLQAQHGGRRLSLHSVGGGNQLPQQEQEQQQQEQQQEQEEQGQLEDEAYRQAGQQPVQQQPQQCVSSGKENAAAQQGEAAGGWQRRGPKSAAAARQVAARQKRQAEGNQSLDRWLQPSQQQREEQQPQEQQAPGGAGPAGSGGAGNGPAGARAVPAVAAADAATPLSPGDSLVLQALVAEVAAAAAGCAESGGAAQLTPPQPAQAAAPRTDKAPVQAAAPLAVVAGTVGGGSNEPAGAGAGAGSGARRAAGRGRDAAAAAAAGTAAAGSGAGQAGGDAAAAPAAAAGGKRARQAAGSVGPGSGRCKPAPAAAVAAAAAGDAEASMPTPPAAAAAGTGGAGGAGSAAAGSRRRIPTRLLPWNCAHCTFENQGSAQKCEMCGLKKKVLAGSELAAIAGATPTAAAASTAAAMAEHQADVAGASPAAALPCAAAGAAGRGGSSGSGRTGRQPQKQRKMSAGGAAAGAAGGGSSGKRRRLDTPAAAGAAAPASVSPAAPAPATGHAGPAAGGVPESSTPRGWRGGGGGSRSWVLLGSSLSAAGRQQLAQLAAAAGATVAKEWGPAVTHVVCGTVDGAARRTFKYLQGVLHAKWVVQESWLEACLAQRRPVDEAPYLVQKDHGGCEGGVAAARSSAGLGLPPLLRGYEIYLAGEFANQGEVGQLLKAAGARQLSRPPAALPAPRAGAGPCTTFLLCEAPDAGGSPAAQQQQRQKAAGRQEGSQGSERAELAVPLAVAASKWYQKAVEGGVPVVSHRWLLDSISCYTLQPLARYRL